MGYIFQEGVYIDYLEGVQVPCVQASIRHAYRDFRRSGTSKLQLVWSDPSSEESRIAKICTDPDCYQIAVGIQQG